VFARQPARKIIVATNVAETSITIPGIKYVIDSGLARISRYSPRTRTTSLPVTPVSRSSCDQRKGRCGRVQNGVCIRLFTEDDYETRPQYTPPEILRANLAEVILRMISLKLGDISEFPFIDRPDLKSVKDGFDLLFELGAIKNRLKAQGSRGKAATDPEGRVLNAECGLRPIGAYVYAPVGMRDAERKTGDRVQKAGSLGAVVTSGGKSQGRIVLTEKGRLMARIPLDPRLSRMLIEAKKEGCIDEITIIVAALSIQDPRERPVEKAREADRVQATFQDAQSDFVTLLNIWHRYHSHRQKVKSNNQMKRFCREHFLSFMRMREGYSPSNFGYIERTRDGEVGMGKSECESRKSEGGRGKGECGSRKAASGP
jgi:ATP-dependent helicase HrpA